MFLFMVQKLVWCSGCQPGRVGPSLSGMPATSCKTYSNILVKTVRSRVPGCQTKEIPSSVEHELDTWNLSLPSRSTHIAIDPILFTL
jgi:hypothetical protein